MDQLDSTTPNTNFIYLMLTGILYATGCVIDNVEIYYVKHKMFFEFIKDVSSTLAWWGGSAVALVTVLNYFNIKIFTKKPKR